MGSDDVSETGDALQQHLQHWRALGFDTSTIELESSPVSTSSLEEIERIIQSALSLSNMLPFRHHIESMNCSNLQNPMLWKRFKMNSSIGRKAMPVGIELQSNKYIMVSR